ncbi:MAG: hypothetical protein RIR10_1776 [Planctomycetota bacterium]
MTEASSTSHSREARATRILDWADSILVADLESQAYEAFHGGNGSPLLRNLWIWDDATRRVRTRVPHEDQQAWVEIDGTCVHTAIIVNTRLAVLQSSAYGFRVPDDLDDGRGICEFTLAYSRLDHSISHFHTAWDEAFHDLRAMGFRDGFATCSRRVLPVYRRMGARILEETQIGEEIRYFLHFDLERTSRWNGRLTEGGDRADAHGLLSEGLPSDDAASRIARARREIGLALARVLLALEIARGQPDPAVGIEARRRGARHVLASVRKNLTECTPSLSGSAVESTLAHTDDVEELWNAVASIIELADGQGHTGEASPAAIIVESIHLLVVNLLDLWDGDASAAELITKLTTGDHLADLAAAAAELRVRGDDQAASALDRLALPFTRATHAIERIAARATQTSRKLA